MHNIHSGYHIFYNYFLLMVYHHYNEDNNINEPETNNTNEVNSTNSNETNSTTEENNTKIDYTKLDKNELVQNNPFVKDLLVKFEILKKGIVDERKKTNIYVTKIKKRRKKR